jgi:hypothetical protein
MRPDWHANYTLLTPTALATLRDGAPPVCPACERARLRFYYHRWEVLPSVPWPRAAIWVWCAECWIAASVSNLTPRPCRYDDPFAELSDTDFPEKGGWAWFDRLNQMWEQGLLPHTIELAR